MLVGVFPSQVDPATVASLSESAKVEPNRRWQALRRSKTPFHPGTPCSFVCAAAVLMRGKRGGSMLGGVEKGKDERKSDRGGRSLGREGVRARHGCIVRHASHASVSFIIRIVWAERGQPFWLRCAQFY